MNPLPATRGAWPTRLVAEIWLDRHGWALPAATVLMLVAASLALTRLAPAQASAAQLRGHLLSAQDRPKANPAPSPAPRPEPGQPLRDLLSVADENPVQVRRIARIALTHGISLPRGQYTAAKQSASGIEHTDITFGFVAGYPQARVFIEDVLRALPNVSVDRVSFERDQVQGAQVEVTLRLAVWRWPAAAQREAGR